jgi:hypothetical protein
MNDLTNLDIDLTNSTNSELLGKVLFLLNLVATRAEERDGKGCQEAEEVLAVFDHLADARLRLRPVVRVMA